MGAQKGKQRLAKGGMPEIRTKKELKRTKGSSTPGKEKGDNCHATSLDKAMAKYPRSYRNDNKYLYQKWSEGTEKFWK